MSVSHDYAAFLAAKAPRAHATGFDAGPMHAALRPDQIDVTAFCLKQGRAALFLDCLGGESTILTSDGAIRIDELTDIGMPINVLSMASSGDVVPAQGIAPFRKGRAALYRVETNRGRVLVATRAHKIMTYQGWKSIGELSVGELLPGYEPFRMGSNLDISPPMSPKDGDRCVQTVEGFPQSYLFSRHLCDEQLRSLSDSGRSFFPSQDDAQELDRFWMRLGARACKLKRNRPRQECAHLSMPDFSRPGLNAPGEQQCQSHSFYSEEVARYNRIVAPEASSSTLAPSILEPHPFGFEFSAVCPLLSPDTIVSIHYIRFDNYYDTHVPFFENYLGDGFISHNTGMGKSLDILEWCDQAARASNGDALILTPLAVAKQFEREAVKFGYDARVVRSQDDVRPGINVCNYDRLDLLDASVFGAVALDESSILKSLNGKTRIRLNEAFKDTPYRLCATATPAPNDHMELGNHAEFLGIMSSQEMLSRWFINDTSDASQTWRLKRAAVTDFWDWVASWARCAETPADLGYDVPGFDLPELKIIRHQAMGDVRAPAGSLFIEDLSATSIHEVKRQTAKVRAEKCAEIMRAQLNEQWLVWTDSDYEATEVKALNNSLIEVRGSMSADKKEEGIEAFLNDGASLLTKPDVCGAGLNFQNCARNIYVGRGFSYEKFYQSVRRTWRYGQTRQVEVHLIVAEGEDQIGRVIDRKADGHKEMKRAMKAAMKRAAVIQQGPKVKYNPTKKGVFPSWLRSAA